MMHLLNKIKSLAFNPLGVFRNYTTVISGSIFIVLTFAFVFFVYESYIERVDVQFPVNRDELGQMGDYFGGLLNPVIAVTALILLYMNLIITQREFKETRKLVDQQLKTQIKQRFEDTFFSLLGQHNVLLNVIQKNNYKFDWTVVDSPERVRKKLWHDVDEKNYEVKVYFRFLYQMLKFIDSGEIEGKDKKIYSNLVRSFIDSDTGELILINALCFNDSDDFKEFKVFIENYAFLEHVQIDTQEEKMCTALDSLKSAYDDDYDELLGKIRKLGSDPNRENLRNQVQNRFNFYSEITKDDRGERYYSKDAYGDRHYYDRVRRLVNEGKILVRQN